jgi:DNA invertase Pin-like site-specific DNA recombinase
MVENGAGPKRVALYLRVSTDEQSQSGYSIPDQRRELLEHADRKGWEVIDVLEDDGHSGAVGVRPGLDKVMALAESGEIDVVLAKKRNRLFRNRYWRLAYERDLYELGVTLVALDDTGNRFADAMNDEFADWYREEVAKNTVAGRMQKARQGKLLATTKPIYGFEYTPDRNAYTVADHKMAVVRRVMELVAETGSLYATKKTLESEGIPAPGGSMVWWERSIRRMVENDAYRPHTYEELAPMLTAEVRGRLDPNGEYGVVWYPQNKITKLDPDPTRNYARPRRVTRYGREEQIPIPIVSSSIPRETIDKARATLRGNVFSRKKGERVYQLSSLIFCTDCGCRMAASHRSGVRKTYHYYRCSNHQRHGDRVCAMNKQFPAEKTELAVLHTVLDAVKNKEELIAQARERFEQQKSTILRVGGGDAAREWHRRLDNLEHQRANYQRAFAADALSLADLVARTAELDAEKEHVSNAIAEHESREKRIKDLEEMRDKTIVHIRHGEWEKLGITAPEARRQRYREIGLRVEAAASGELSVSWGMGEKAVVSTAGQTS